MIKLLLKKFLYSLPLVKDYLKLRVIHQNKTRLCDYLKFKLNKNKKLYWPISPLSKVTHPNNIFVGINVNAGLQSGCYIQGNGKVFIGDYVEIAMNCGVISGNHDVYEQMKHYEKEVIIGDYCWIGMNSVILPGVVLGKRTIVAAGAVVTKSFPAGACIIGGNPAKLIKELDRSKLIFHKNKDEFYGYIPKHKFKKYRTKFLTRMKFETDLTKLTDNEFYQPRK